MTSAAPLDRKFVDVIAADGSRPRVAVQYAPMHSIGHPESRSALLALVDGLLRSGILHASRVFTPGDAPPTPRRVGWWASAPPPTHLKAKTDPPTSAGCSPVGTRNLCIGHHKQTARSNQEGRLCRSVCCVPPSPTARASHRERALLLRQRHVARRARGHSLCLLGTVCGVMHPRP